MMGTVYQNSYYNIAAVNAEDSLGECFFMRRSELICPYKVTLEWNDKEAIPFYFIDERTMEKYLGKKKLLTERVWVLQEQRLPLRALPLGTRQVDFQCLNHTACETLPLGSRLK